MDAENSSAPAQPSTDETIEAQYSGLERLGDAPHGCPACYRGLVYLTYEEDGHEWTESVPCRCCSAG